MSTSHNDSHDSTDIDHPDYDLSDVSINEVEEIPEPVQEALHIALNVIQGGANDVEEFYVLTIESYGSDRYEVRIENADLFVNSKSIETAIRALPVEFYAMIMYPNGYFGLEFRDISDDA